MRSKLRFGINLKLLALLGTILVLSLGALLFSTTRELKFLVFKSGGVDNASAPTAPLATPDGKDAKRLIILNDGRPNSMVAPVNDRIKLYALGIGLLALVGGIALGMHITKPLKTLLAATRRIEQGEYGHGVPVKSNDEIGELTESFNSMSATLKKNAELRKRLIADVAHELRTPLTGLRCQLEALRDGIAPFTAEKLHGLLVDAIQLQQLIEDLQELSRVEDGSFKIETRICSIAEIIDSAIAPHLTNSRRVVIRTETGSNVPQLITDPHRLRQVLVNVLVNAIRFSPEEASISVAAKRQGDKLEISIQDQGPGIPANELENVFERLYRVDQHRNRDEGGSGLGLAIARELMTRLGGNITAELPVEGGTRIKITLPLAGTA